MRFQLWPAAATYLLPNFLKATASSSSSSLVTPPLPLPATIQENYFDCVNSTGLIVHTLSAGCDESRSKPLVLLLHGFPEVAYTWIHVMPALAKQNNYCIVSPDLRGSGRTTGWDTRPYAQVNVGEFSNTNMVRDLVALVYALGYTEAFSIIGHDYGAIIAAWASLIRPDMFRSSIHITNPFDAAPLPTHPAPAYSGGPPVNVTVPVSGVERKEAALCALNPPRKYYQLSNAQAAAANDWNTGGKLGLRQFLRSYFYVKSADWPENHPHPLQNDSAEQLAEIPRYYVMHLNESMSESVASLSAGYRINDSQKWLPDNELAVSLAEYERVGFQGQLNWYRALTAPLPDEFLMSGRKIVVPVLFIAGDKDWGTFQHPGALERYNQSCTDYRGKQTISGAGHWPQLEQPKALTQVLNRFLQSLESE